MGDQSSPVRSLLHNTILSFKMPPVEQNTVPVSHAYVVSLGELKTVGKASEVPVVSDTFKVAASYASQISENSTVQSAKQYVEDGIKTISETETFSSLQVCIYRERLWR